MYIGSTEEIPYFSDSGLLGKEPQILTGIGLQYFRNSATRFAFRR